MSDLVLRGARIVDPALGVDDVLDLVLRDGSILGLEPPGQGIGSVEDVSGAVVVPGLVDLHGHWYEASPFGIDSRANLKGGVTCAVDAGTAGYANFGEFRRHSIETAEVRIRAFVHVAATGLATAIVGELEDIRFARPLETAAIVRANRDIVVGVKVRIGTSACGANGAAALAAALQAAELAEVPLMAHISEGADVSAVVGQLRSGDVVTHSFTGSGLGILDDDGRVRREVLAARRRGVLFDVGHGCGSFSWAVARRAVNEGFGPDSISTDLSRYSLERPVVDLPTTMAKFLYLGLSWSEVVTATTSRPASIIGDSTVGVLRPGGVADVTVLAKEPEAMLVDAHSQGDRAEGLRPILTIVAGRVFRPETVEVHLRDLLPSDPVDCVDRPAHTLDAVADGIPR